MEIEINFDKLKAAKEQGHIQWEPRKTLISQLPEEDLRKLCGVELSNIEIKDIQIGRELLDSIKAQKTLEVSPYPVPTKWRWDNVNCENWITPVKDQKSCGSCTAFGVLGALESFLKIHHYKNSKTPIDLSEAHLFYCAGGTCSTSKGLSKLKALEYLKDNGVPPESCFPYKVDGTCNETCSNWRNLVGPTKGIEYSRVSNDLPRMQKRLVKFGPQITSMTGFRDFYYYGRGVYKPISIKTTGTHCVCVIGYDDLKECWICKNSWGTDWGDNGFFMIDYYACDIIGAGFYSFLI